MKSHKINIFDQYDQTIAQDIGKIVNMSDEKNVLISNFDFNNKVDLYILNICNIIRDCFGYNIYIDCSFLNFLKLKFSLKNKKIKKYKKNSLKTYIGASTIIYNNIAENICSFSYYSEIYDNYYNYKELKRKEKGK